MIVTKLRVSVPELAPRDRRDREGAGAKTFSVANGGTAVQNSSSPTSVYVAFPDETGYEIEVYAPDPAKALDLVKSGDIQPVS